MSTSMETALAARDLIFEPAELYLAESGKPTVIHFTNKGALTHHFHIDELGIEAEAQPGATVDIEIQGGTPAGIYTFYCSVPGHKEAGMFGTLVIYPGNATPITTVRDVVDPSGCAGFQGYIDRYDAATANAIAANPEAVALFGGSPDTGHTLSPFDLTPEQLMLVSEYFSDMGSALAQIDPRNLHAPGICSISRWQRPLRSSSNSRRHTILLLPCFSTAPDWMSSPRKQPKSSPHKTPVPPSSPGPIPSRLTAVDPLRHKRHPMTAVSRACRSMGECKPDQTNLALSGGEIR